MSTGNAHWGRTAPCVTVLALLIVASTPSSCSGGAVLRLQYDNIAGTSVSKLTADRNFPLGPTKHEVLTESLGKLAPSGEKYGALIRGYIEAPQTGEYQFCIASDDHSDFWLSTNHVASKRQRIAWTSSAVGPRSYKNPGQTSEPVHLVRGEKYYFEVLHKENLHEDHFSVAWKLPDGKMEDPVSAVHLMPLPVDEQWNPIDKAPQFLTTYFDTAVPSLKNASVKEGGNASFVVTVEASPPAVLQWFHNGEPVAGANLSTFVVPRIAMSNDVDIVNIIASNRLGTASASAVISVIADTNRPASHPARK